MYFSNSHDSRDLPIPAIPTTETSCALPLLGGGVEELLDQPQLAVAADERRLEARRPQRAARGRRSPAARGRAAWARPCPSARARPRPRRRSRPRVARLVASPTRTVAGLGVGLDPRRRVDEVARDHALALGAEGDRCLAGQDARAGTQLRDRARADAAATSSSAARTARSASSSFATGVPHTAITASPMNFSTVPP